MNEVAHETRELLTRMVDGVDDAFFAANPERGVQMRRTIEGEAGLVGLPPLPAELEAWAAVRRVRVDLAGSVLYLRAYISLNAGTEAGNSELAAVTFYKRARGPDALAREDAFIARGHEYSARYFEAVAALWMLYQQGRPPPPPFA